MQSSWDLTLKTYQVGGAVRDTLLGFPYNETDWVVVGCTPEQMISAGYTQVGRDFPVFLHPDSKEEYALARTERKSGPGYCGFVVHADPSVTLEEDLARRDLTINAMAMDETGRVIDPYGGQRDLKAKVLRHVSPSFSEDPLRVLRVARFAARYHHLGFTVAPDTMALMADIVSAGELPHLSIERVWVETDKALGEAHPEIYFETLKACGALEVILPELMVSQGLAALTRSAAHTQRKECRWAALLVDLPDARVTAANARLKTPQAFSLLALRVSDWRPKLKAALKDSTLCITLLKGLDALRREEPFGGFCETLVALESNSPEAQAAIKLLREARTAAQSVSAADFADQGVEGPAMGAAIEAAQIERIAALLG